MDIAEMMDQFLRNYDPENKMSEKQKKIVAAAIEIFSEKGFAATSTSEIAKKAGVAEGTIFRHYKTKKDLLISIVMPTMIKYVAPFFAKNFSREIFENEHKSFESFLRKMIQNRFDFAKQNFPILKIYMQEVFYHEELQGEFRKVFLNHVYEKFKNIILHFQEKGEIVFLPPDTVIRMIISTVLGFMVNRFVISPEKVWNDEEEIEQTVQFLLNGLKR
ncbi:TetR/AcrR family transcriptional regulator [Bacillus sp. FJAT-47783]|uniref:TetR/AcrR family transcriptional regulator n=1 Tax=Bacillus sp. FJAT-47783 TaxID=2922712 RepID=UPI001FAC473D|nr:TetR/AcrR family transcriptional regulator [Bacillus sp. FJAT-47783]